MKYCLKVFDIYNCEFFSLSYNSLDDKKEKFV